VKLVVTELGGPGADERGLEVVERKGIGHPDTICDALCEELSRALSRHYLAQAGRVLHHNVDKALLRGGVARPAFGGGQVLEPIEIYLAGRATAEVGGVRVPIEDLAHEAVNRWLATNLHAVVPERHVRLHCLVRPGSVDLVELFGREHASRAPLANDTSYGAGYWPLSELERTVLAIEAALVEAAHTVRPELGEDVKVMGFRHANGIHLTVACPLIDRHVDSLEDYIEGRTAVAELAHAAASRVTKTALAIEVNAADDIARRSIYLTVTGTSAESGDDGQVGRGNRVNGLIPFRRPLSLEAAAGKNPVTHVGKLYNLAAHRISRAIVGELPHVTEAHCHLLSRIGQPIDRPQAAELAVRLASGAALASLQTPLEELLRAHLDALPTLWRELVTGHTPIC